VGEGVGEGVGKGVGVSVAVREGDGAIVAVMGDVPGPLAGRNALHPASRSAISQKERRFMRPLSKKAGGCQLLGRAP